MKIFSLIFLTFLFYSCYSAIDKTMWKFDNSSRLNSLNGEAKQRTLRIDGYYTNNKRIINHTSEMTKLILFNDGYMSSINRLITNTELDYSKISKEISGTGKYKITGDSILIQYFRNYETSGNFFGPIKYSVTEVSGLILSDSSFMIVKGAFNSRSEFWGRKGINYEIYDPPVTYYFIKIDTTFNSDSFIDKRF